MYRERPNFQLLWWSRGLELAIGLTRMQLFIRSAKTFILTADPHDTVWSVKLKVEAREGIPAAQQNILHAGRLLEDWGSLNGNGISAEHTLHVVLCFRPQAGPAYYSAVVPRIPLLPKRDVFCSDRVRAVGVEASVRTAFSISFSDDAIHCYGRVLRAALDAARFVGYASPGRPASSPSWAVLSAPSTPALPCILEEDALNASDLIVTPCAGLKLNTLYALVLLHVVPCHGSPLFVADDWAIPFRTAPARAALADVIADCFTCGVCLEPCVEPTSTPCGHNFCIGCLSSWIAATLDAAPKCPSCRAVLPELATLRVNVAVKSAIEAALHTRLAPPPAAHLASLPSPMHRAGVKMGRTFET